MADSDCAVCRPHQVHGWGACSTQPKVLYSAFWRITSRSTVHIGCLKNEDPPTAKIAERYVAGRVSTRGYHGLPGSTVAAAGPIEFGFFEALDEPHHRGGVHFGGIIVSLLRRRFPPAWLIPYSPPRATIANGPPFDVAL